MSEYTYNTDHGNFRIKARKMPHLLKALEAHVKETDPDGNDYVFEALHEAGKECGFGYVEITDGPDAGDIIDLFVESSYFGEDEEKLFLKVVSPFVEEGSYLVFAFGGVDAFWAIHYTKNNETDKVEGAMADVDAVLNSDLGRMLEALRQSDPSLYKEMRAKYPTYNERTAVHLENGGNTTADSAGATKES